MLSTHSDTTYTIKNEEIIKRVVDLYNMGYTYRGIRRKVMKDSNFSIMLSTITIKRILEINGLILDKEQAHSGQADNSDDNAE